jgi:protein TonB
VLVAATFRPPTVYDDAPPIPPVEHAVPSNEIPFPVATKRPLYPVQAVADGVALVEVLIGSDGRVREATFRNGERAFEDVALEAARGWSFRPAHRNGEVVEAFAYLAFGFRRPVTSAK